MGEGARRSAPPSVRRLATELGVDLERVRPSDPGGQVTAADVRRAAAAAAAETRRRAQVPRLAAAAAVPSVTLVDAADLEAVLEADISPPCAVARACVVALGEHPSLNAWLGDRATPQRHAAVHLGVVTPSAAGMVVPVVHHAERLSAADLDAAITEARAAVRDHRARPEDLEGSTFTIDGGWSPAALLGTALLNVPEVALLGLHRVEPRPVPRDGKVMVRRTVNLTLTVDQRAVDSPTAAAFLTKVVALLEHWPEGC